MKPKVPKLEKPKIPEKPEESPIEERVTFRPQGRGSLISAGRLTRKPTTRKASLLSGY